MTWGQCFENWANRKRVQVDGSLIQPVLIRDIISNSKIFWNSYADKIYLSYICFHPKLVKWAKNFCPMLDIFYFTVISNVSSLPEFRFSDFKQIKKEWNSQVHEASKQSLNDYFSSKRAKTMNLDLLIIVPKSGNCVLPEFWNSMTKVSSNILCYPTSGSNEMVA